MLEAVAEKTNEYIEQMPKKERKQYGQFFTSLATARFMANMYDFNNLPAEVKLLDAGAGSGILACALLERLEQEAAVEKITVVCYENDEKILALLRENLAYCQQQSKKEVCFEIREENYILAESVDFNFDNDRAEKYDLVIGNPPYMKIAKQSAEAVAMLVVCYGAPNLYFLFASLGLFNLKQNAELVYIIPRSWTSGAYFKRFREYFLAEGRLAQVHLFVSRDKVFDKESVLQETMIIKMRKTQRTPATVKITSSVSGNDFSSVQQLVVPYDVVVNGANLYVYLPTTEQEVKVLETMQQWHNTLPSLGMKMKTGLTVDFRNYDLLVDEAKDSAVPLFYPQHLKNGRVEFPVQREKEYILTDRAGLLQQNENYLFVKRFTAKEEHRRLQSAIYLAKNFADYVKISTQNKLNFIDGVTIELSECLVYGLYVLFNSTLFDVYYRILNGSTQVNSTEINAMPIPNLEDIQSMGRQLMQAQDLSESKCDEILEGYITAFLDFKTYKKFSDDLAWDTEVWIAEAPDHMIHLNGDRFYGPRN